MPAKKQNVFSIIAVAGLAGSGKNTAAAIVAKSLGWRQVEPTFKDLAAREGVSLEQFQKKAAADKNIDLKFDEELKKQCAGGNCVVSTWLGPWMAPLKPFKVWLDVSLDERAKRVAGRENQPLEEAKAKISARDLQNVERYHKVYGINILDHSKFDLVLDSTHSKPDEVARKILDAFFAYRAKHSD